jgi:hypothetical protein
VGLAYCLVVGSGVAIACNARAADEDRQAYASWSPSGSEYGSGYGSYRPQRTSYASDDRVGRALGLAVAGNAVLPLVFLIVFLVMKPKGAPAYAQYGGGPAPYAPYPQQYPPPAPYGGGA